MATKGKYGKIIFSSDDIRFISNNFHSMTNRQLADAMGLKMTTVRTKAYSMGLRRMALEHWPEKATQYLKDNYRKIGDREIVRHFNKTFPKKKGWTVSHISKKMAQLNLKRNKLDWYIIKERNRRNGSFGKMDINNRPDPPEVFVRIDHKTRVMVRPGMDIDQVKSKYHLLRC